MDGAQALCLYSAVRLKLWQVGGRRGHDEAFGVSLGETVASADLGGSSKYANENFEDQSGERFHVNSSWTWVSQS